MPPALTAQLPFSYKRGLGLPSYEYLWVLAGTSVGKKCSEMGISVCGGIWEFWEVGLSGDTFTNFETRARDLAQTQAALSVLPSRAQGGPSSPQRLQAGSAAAVRSPAGQLQEGRAARAGLEDTTTTCRRCHCLCHPQRGERPVSLPCSRVDLRSGRPCETQSMAGFWCP